MYEAHDALICIGEKNFVDDKNRFRYSNQHYLNLKKNLENYIQIYLKHLENNYNFHLRFNFKPKKSKPILPSIASKESISRRRII
jgi:DNA polymerase-3 subunit alpha